MDVVALRRSRPFRNSSAMMNATPTTSPPSCSTSSHFAVARAAGREHVVVDEHALAAGIASA